MAMTWYAVAVWGAPGMYCRGVLGVLQRCIAGCGVGVYCRFVFRVRCRGIFKVQKGRAREQNAELHAWSCTTCIGLCSMNSIQTGMHLPP